MLMRLCLWTTVTCAFGFIHHVEIRSHKCCGCDINMVSLFSFPLQILKVFIIHVMSNSNSLPTAVVSPLILNLSAPQVENCALKNSDGRYKYVKEAQSSDINTILSQKLLPAVLREEKNNKETDPSIAASTNCFNLGKCCVELTKVEQPYNGKKFCLRNNFRVTKTRPQARKTLLESGATMSKVTKGAQKSFKKDISSNSTFKKSMEKLPSCSKTKNVQENPERVTRKRTRSNQTAKRKNEQSFEGSVTNSKCRRKSVQLSSSISVPQSAIAQNTNLFDVFVPSMSNIVQTFSSDITVCSFCHLPANYLPTLGDLFGPYRPSFNEVWYRYRDRQKQLSFQQNKNVSTTSHRSIQSIRVDRNEKTCFIPSSYFENQRKIDSDLEGTSLQSMKHSEKNVHSMVPQLRMYQTIDCVLSEAAKKPAAKFCRNSKSLRIPGFSGKVSNIDQDTPSRAEANKHLLHDMSTIVFIEPTHTISFNEDQDDTTSVHHSSDETTVNVVHKFDVSPIWVHAPCAVWTPGVFCVQNEVYGLISAVRQASNTSCHYCQKSGATIPCKYKKNINYHYLCCLAKGLTLDEDTCMAVG